MRSSTALFLGSGLVILLVAASAAGAPKAKPPQCRGIPDMVARVLPAVVSITTRQIERNQFGEAVPTRGLGSGVIVDRRGYILTNNHVVEGADQIKVGLVDERTFPATLVGADGFTDLAVIKIDGRNLPAAVLGDSSRLRVGESVVAIGNPLWIEGGPTVTVGVVSGLKRSMEQEGLPMLHHLIQTDAAINPGNSGGPLLNLAGQVVGINTALIPSAHGIGFAVDIATAKPVLAALIATGRVVRATLRLTAISVTPQVAYANDLPVERGALIVKLEPGGAGEAAGLQANDVITAVGGVPVRDLHEFHIALAGRKIGERVALSVRRGPEILTVTTVLEEYR